MRNGWFAIVLASVMAGCLSNVSVAQQPAEHVPGELLVGFKSEQAADEGVKLLKTLEQSPDGVKTRGAGSVKVERLDETSAVLKFDFKGPDGVNLRGALSRLEEYAKKLRDDPRVEYAHPNWIMKLDQGFDRRPVYFEERKFKPPVTPMSVPSGPNDTYFLRGLHWHYLAPPVGMNAIAAWPKTKGDKSVVVAVIDTGILLKHPDIDGSANVLPGYDFISLEKMDGDGQTGRDSDPTDPGDQCVETGSDASWHGTHVAGTIGAAITNNGRDIAGVNWSISVVPVRALGRCGGTIADLAAAIRWSAGLSVPGVPKNPHKADIINMSLGLGLPCTAQNVALLMNAIAAADKAGSTVVVAAGNEKVDIKRVTPGGCTQVISVAASDRRGHLAPYSNYGKVTIMAPGGDIRRDDDGDGMPDGVWSLVAVSQEHKDGVAAYQGTSMAAPHVSAAFALLLARRPEFKGKPAEIERLLTRSAAKLPSGACSKPCGPGLLDAAAMLEIDLSISKSR
jgi:subtilisin family serine protease